MERGHRDKLRFLAKKGLKESAKLDKENDKNRDNAGHSEDGGTGDEGWSQLFLNTGMSLANAACARDLIKLIQEIEDK